MVFYAGRYTSDTGTPLKLFSSLAARFGNPGQWLAYLLFRGFLWFCALLPLRVNRAIGRCLGDLYYYLTQKRVHIARVNMRICFPGLSAQEQEQRVKESLRHAGMWIMECGPVWLWPREKILAYIDVVNPEVLTQAMAGGRGVILAIPHLGNWEVMGPLLTKDYPFACFYKHDKHALRISHFVHQQRSRNGTRMAPADASGVRILYKHIKAGHLAGLLPDHNPATAQGVFVPFFGRLALTSTLITSLASKNSAPVIVAAAVRTPRGFQVHYLPVENQHSGDVVLGATSVNRAIEQAIALAPEQFQWVYPRFNKRPDRTQPSPYKRP